MNGDANVAKLKDKIQEELLGTLDKLGSILTAMLFNDWNSKGKDREHSFHCLIAIAQDLQAEALRKVEVVLDRGNSFDGSSVPELRPSGETDGRGCGPGR